MFRLSVSHYCFRCSMDGGELFSRIAERGIHAFTERGLFKFYGQRSYCSSTVNVIWQSGTLWLHGGVMAVSSEL